MSLWLNARHLYTLVRSYGFNNMPMKIELFSKEIIECYALYNK